jgi:membrane protease YdiL (CAAX protease family)
LLSTERLVTSIEKDSIQHAGGTALLGRRVLPWFIILWAVLLIVGGYIGDLDLRLQVFINVVVLIFGTSFIMVRWHHVKPKDAFALRLPKPEVWFGLLVAAPCGILAGTGLFRLMSFVFPVPQEVIEAFSEALLPPGIPLWQVLLFLAVLPGVMEELAFRGALLHGLHRRLHPVALALVVGTLFGLFHGALFRVAPTAFLGVLLAVVTMLTGSIFPAMLWHVMNNTLALLAEILQLPVAELEPGWYFLGTLGLAAGLWIIWRHRTPYPGLRAWRSPGANLRSRHQAKTPGLRLLV